MSDQWRDGITFCFSLNSVTLLSLEKAQLGRPPSENEEGEPIVCAVLISIQDKWDKYS